MHPEFRSTYDTTLLCMTDQGFYILCKGAVVEFSFEGVKVPRGEQMRVECYFCQAQPKPQFNSTGLS